MVDLGKSHVIVQGQFVSAKAEQVCLAIKEYEPEIEIQWVPPGARIEGQAAYKIIHAPVGQPPFTLFHVQNDEDFDERVLMRIIANDQRYTDVTLSDYEAYEMANMAVQRQAVLDKLEEQADIVAHVLQSPLNTYKINDDLIIKDGIPFNAAKRRG